MTRYSYSSLQTLAQCERKFALRHIEGLESDKPTPLAPLRGTAWHAVIQADLVRRGAQRNTLLYRPDTIKILDDLTVTIDWTVSGTPTIPAPHFGPETELTPELVIAHVRAWENDQESDRKDAMAAEYGASLAERLQDLWIRYRIHYGNETDQVLLTEYEWAREAPNGELLQGRVDAVVFREDLGLVIARDYKTHESWPSEADHVLDLMDSQLHLQAWGVAPLLKEHGLIPQAVEFDRVRFKKPTLPKLTTKGALNKSVKDYDGYTYRQWCNSAEAKEAGYEFDQEVFDKAEENRDAWFRRSMKPLSMRAVEAHVKSAQAAVVRAKSLDPATATLVPSKACGWCEFLSLCRAEIIGGRPEHFVPADYNLRYQK
jgi:hypothetical protein